MNGRTSKALITTAIGLLIGIALVPKLQTIYTWLAWIAPFVGGIFGYLSYEFRTVWKAVGQAWTEVSGSKITRKGILQFLHVIGLITATPIVLMIIGFNLSLIVFLPNEPEKLIPGSGDWFNLALLGLGISWIVRSIAEDFKVLETTRFEGYPKTLR
ncbi:MAG: hypothetical protein AAB787_02945 [Patescibacteria group bacterium]